MGSVLTRKPCYGLAEVCARWGVSEVDIANFAIGGELVLSVVVARLPVEKGKIETGEDDGQIDPPNGPGWFSGTLDLWADDAWHVVMDGSHGVSSFEVESDRYCNVRCSNDAAELIVPRERLVVRHAELVRFEAAYIEVAVETGEPSTLSSSAARGAPARYDWDEFWCETAVILHVDGMPETQAALVRQMTGWFEARGQFPDASTVKKKVNLLWRRHAEALSRTAA